MVAEADDALMEKFFDAGTLTQDELVSGPEARRRAPGASSRSFCASAAANIGMQPLLDAIVAYVPSPAERPLRGEDGGGRRRRDPDARRAAPAAAFVWKTVADPFAGRITMFRVISGTLKSDSTMHNQTRDTRERLGHLRAAAGEDADQRARDQGRRHRRRREAEGDADERRPRRERGAGPDARRSSSPSR